MSDEKKTKKTPLTPQSGDRGQPIQKRESGLFDSITAVWRSRNRLKRSQAETELLDALSDLGESGIRFRQVQDKVGDIGTILKADAARREADMVAEQNRVAEEKRKAKHQEQQDTIADLDQQIEIETKKQQLGKLNNPPPEPTPPEPKTPREVLEDRVRTEAELDEWLADELTSIDERERDDELTEEEAKRKRKNAHDRHKQAVRNL